MTDGGKNRRAQNRHRYTTPEYYARKTGGASSRAFAQHAATASTLESAGTIMGMAQNGRSLGGHICRNRSCIVFCTSARPKAARNTMADN